MENTQETQNVSIGSAEEKYSSLYWDLYNQILMFGKRSSKKAFRAHLDVALQAGMPIDFIPEKSMRRTLLFWAIINNCAGNEKLKAIEVLLEAGAGVNYTDEYLWGRNALMIMVLTSNETTPQKVKVIKEIAERTTDLNYKDAQGDTVFQHAINRMFLSTTDDTPVISALIQAGADPVFDKKICSGDDIFKKKLDAITICISREVLKEQYKNEMGNKLETAYDCEL
ncbi:hypothetical protein [uncultured Cloacibacillus sp.]|uniref:hypothetical protein n=1 Tax=uncultured Cloacibacillus sp. TaxID=889794 RepID=UPI0026DD238F|nr:hypothetical protein [uncultured Cloacibacillus sp.]